MSRTQVVLLFSIALGLRASLLAQDPCATIRDAKQKTYGFHPAKLSKPEREQKSKQMDAFWDLVKQKGPEGLSCVRGQIETEKEDKYFLFDAASILAAFDQTGNSDKAILEGLLGTDLQDVDAAGYISVALQLSHRDVDIGPVANKYLHAPHVTTYLPRHGGYELDRARGAVLLYGSMSPAMVDQYLDAEIQSPDSEVRDTAAIMLSLNMTEASFKTIASLGTGDGLGTAREQVMSVRTYRIVRVTRPSKYTREEMLQKVARFPEIDPDINEAEDQALDNSVYATFTAADVGVLQEGRRRMIQGVSNESVEGYAEISRVLLNLINVLDLDKDYRIH
jgi:hypothetical protein